MTDSSPTQTILSARDVSRVFTRFGNRRVALRNISFTVEHGKTLAVVGESGAGKSTLARLITGLDTPTEGQVLVDGRPPTIRAGRAAPVQLVFQNPSDALDPRLSIGYSVGEALRGLRGSDRKRRVGDELRRVGLRPDQMSRRPGSFSGGQLQRIVLARALAPSPHLLVCDEPTSALDVSVQAQIVNLLLDLQARLHFACVVVTHDLGVVRVLADDILLLRHGEAVEHTPADEFFEQPRSAYGQSLLAATAAQSL